MLLTVGVDSPQRRKSLPRLDDLVRDPASVIAWPASGPAPRIELLPNRTEKTGSTVKLAVRVIDASCGIGNKVVWRVNGTTQGGGSRSASGKGDYT